MLELRLSILDLLTINQPNPKIRNPIPFFEKNAFHSNLLNQAINILL